MPSGREHKNKAIGTTNFLYKNKEVIIEIFQPTQVGEHEFRCNFSFFGESLKISDTVTALDSMQAIVLALAVIGTYLRDHDDIDHNAIEWPNGVLEFPTFPPRN